MRYFEFLAYSKTLSKSMTVSESHLVADAMFLCTKPLKEPFHHLLKNISRLMQSNSPSCFMSYAWANDLIIAEELWTQEIIYRIGDWIKLAGIDAIIDYADSRFGNRMPPFMEKNVKNSKFVLLFGTKTLRKKLDDNTTFYNVKKEYDCIKNKIKDGGNVIPVIISGKKEEALPDELFGNISTEDFSGNLLLKVQTKSLIENLYELIANLHSINLTEINNPISIQYKKLWDHFKQYYVYSQGNGIGNLTNQINPFLHFQQAEQRKIFFGKTKTYLKFRMPDPNNIELVGRMDDLSKLKAQINQYVILKTGNFFQSENKNDYARGFRKCYSITTIVCGIGGVGKTSLVKEFLIKLKEENPNLLIISIKVPDKVDNRLYAQLIADLGFNVGTSTYAEQQRQFFQWLADRPGWILFLDNVSDQKSIQSYLPPEGGNIIITSRSAAWIENLYLKKFPLKKLQEKESCEILRIDHSDDEMQLALLAQKLDHLPLALSHARGYMLMNEMSNTKYLEIYEKHPIKLSQFEFEDNGETKSVWLTLNLSLEQIKIRNSESIKLIQICALFGYLDLPCDFLQKLMGCLDAIEFNKRLSPILFYYLVNSNIKGDTISLHPIVSNIIFHSFSLKDLKNEIENSCHVILTSLSLQNNHVLVGLFLELLQKSTKLHNSEFTIHPKILTELLVQVMPILLKQDNMSALNNLVPHCRMILEDKLFRSQEPILYLKLLNVTVSYHIKFRSGFEYLEKKFSEYVQCGYSISHQLEGIVALNQGRIYLELGRLSIAGQYLSSAISNEALADSDRSDAYLNFCTTIMEEGNDIGFVEKQVNDARNFLKKLENNDRTIDSITYLNGNLANYYMKRNHLSQAKDLREENIRLLNTVKTQNVERGLSWNYFGLSQIACTQGDVDSAEKNYLLFVRKMNLIYQDLSKWPEKYIETKVDLESQISKIQQMPQMK